MNLLKIENLTKEYKTKVEDIKIFSNINLTIDKGDLISIQGKSGSGKTTLLNILGLLDTKYDGKVEFFNQSSYKSLEKLRAKNIGFVFQFHYLLPEFTALENVMLPALAMKESSKYEIRKRAIQLLKLVDLEDRIKFYPSELSGGQKQRVAIARALINNPSIVLADEPTGNLDEENSKKINDLFIKLNKENAQTIILVTHSQNLANIANKKYILKNRELVVVEQLKQDYNILEAIERSVIIMNVIVSGQHLKLTDALREYAIMKCKKVLKYCNNITEVKVMLSVEKTKTEGAVHHASATIYVAGKTINEECKDKSLYSAIDAMLDIMVRQVTKYKEIKNKK